MPKITLIGAGSVAFALRLSSDILLTPALQDATIPLMDTNPGRLAQAQELVQAIMLDPLTGAACTLPQIRAMVDAILDAQARWLPQFAA